MNNMTFIKGMGLGLAVGSMVGMIALPRKKKVSLGKALKSMGDVVDNVMDGLGF